MRRKLTTLRAKMGHSANGCDRTLADIALYREKHNNHNAHANNGAVSPHSDTGFSGWSNASRPRDSSISIRSIVALNG